MIWPNLKSFKEKVMQKFLHPKSYTIFAFMLAQGAPYGHFLHLYLNRRDHDDLLFFEFVENYITQYVDSILYIWLGTTFFFSLFGHIFDRIYAKLKINIKIKNQYFATVAHDLRNPIAFIKSYLELISENQEQINKNPIDQETLKHLSKIKNINNFMYQLVNDMLDFSQIDSDHCELSAKNVDLKTFMIHIIESFQLLAKQKNIQIQFSFDPNKNFIVDIDEIKFEQVISNLLSNALKYSPFNSEIICSLMIEQEQVVCIIKDQGPGIKVDQIKKLFLPFSQLGSRTTNHEMSTGLGLYICKKIIDLHHGELIVQNSSVGKGLEALIKLKLSKNMTEVTNVFSPLVKELPNESNYQKLKILFVDDSIEAIELYRIMMKKLPFDFFYFNSSKDALSFLKNHQMDLAFIDLNMPDINGFQMIKMIREQEIVQLNLNPIYVVALSASLDQELAQKTFKAGFNEYITKPINRQSLMTVINKINEKNIKDSKLNAEKLENSKQVNIQQKNVA